MHPSRKRLTSGKQTIITHLSVSSLELTHERHERVDTLFRERVVDRCTHPAHRAVSLQAVETRRSGCLYELLFELLAREPERDVHQRTALLVGRAAVEAGL